MERQPGGQAELGVEVVRASTSIATRPLAAIVVCFTPSNPARRSVGRCGVWDGSDRKFTRPRADAQIRRSPRSSGEGRLRASFAVSATDNSAYSASRCRRQKSAAVPATSSNTSHTVTGT